MVNPIQDARVLPFHSGTSTVSNGAVIPVGDYDGTQVIEIVNIGSGSAIAAIEGSFGTLDASANQIWYIVGYEQRDNIASAGRVVTNINVPATSAHVYLVDDPYDSLRVRIVSVSGTPVIYAKLKLTAI